MRLHNYLDGFFGLFSLCNRALATWKTLAGHLKPGCSPRILPLLLLVLPAAVQAQFTFATNNSTITITGYTGSGGDVIVPDTTNGYPVASIGTNAFDFCTNVTSITIPSSVTTIGAEAFVYCFGLTNVTIPDSVISLGVGVFWNCTSLTNVIIPGSISQMGYGAFGYSGLISVTISDGVTTIAQDAFAHTTLSSVTIPGSVTNLGDSAFAYCFNLTCVTISNGLSSIASSAFQSCYILTNVSIPKSVTNIEANAFAACYVLTNLTLPARLLRIGSTAFSGCNLLRSLTIPETVTYIDFLAFSSCRSLKSVYFKGNAPAVGSGVFSGDTNTVYYLPGTTNWGATFATRPAVLWNPTIQTTNSTFGVQNNGFGFTISGTTNIPIAVSACTDLANPIWTNLQSCTLTNGSIYFTDPNWTSYPARLYRIRSP